MKVKLEEVLEALDFANYETQYYYDVKNEKILMVFDGMVDGEDDQELIEKIEDGFIEDYIPLPGQYEIHAYQIMEEFIYDLGDGKQQEILAGAIRGRGAFRRFKDRLYDLNLQQKWYDYRDSTYERIAREWCEKYNLEVVE